jgi:hypothetical protein
MHISSLPCVLHVPVNLRLHPPTNFRCWRVTYKSWHFSFCHVSPAVYFLWRRFKQSRSAICHPTATIKILQLKITRTNTFTSHYFECMCWRVISASVLTTLLGLQNINQKMRVLLIMVKNLGASFKKTENLLRTSRGMYKLKKSQ